MDRPLRCPVKPSRFAQYCCCGMVALCCLAVCLADLSWYWQALLAAQVIGAGWRTVMAIRRSPVEAITCDAGQWQLVLAGSGQAVVPGRDTFIAAGIISLQCHLPSGKRCRIVLWPDSAPADSLRSLRKALLR